MHRSLIAVACMVLTPNVFAQDNQAALQSPDPASITVPDLSHSGEPNVVANGWKYFFFHKEGVTFTQAHGDISECFGFLRKSNWYDVMLPRFVPWRRPNPAIRKATYEPGYYGLVGDLIAGMVEGTLVRRDLQSKMRRCMETRGYSRYGVAEEVWENVIALPPEQAIAIEAKIASGPNFGGKVPLK